MTRSDGQGVGYRRIGDGLSVSVVVQIIHAGHPNSTTCGELVHLASIHQPHRFECPPHDLLYFVNLLPGGRFVNIGTKEYLLKFVCYCPQWQAVWREGGWSSGDRAERGQGLAIQLDGDFDDPVTLIV